MIAIIIALGLLPILLRKELISINADQVTLQLKECIFRVFILQRQWLFNMLFGLLFDWPKVLEQAELTLDQILIHNKNIFIL